MNDERLLGPPCSHADLLDYEITEKIKKEEEDKRAGKIRSHPLRPSSAGFCARRLAYELMEYRGFKFYDKPLLEPHVYRLFELGHGVENHVLNTFKLLKGFEQRYKQQILTFFPLARASKDLPLEMCEGSADGVLWSSHYKGIFDVKSKKDKFSAIFKSGWDEEIEKLCGMEGVMKLSETGIYVDDLDSFIDDLNDDWLVDNLYQLNLYALSDFMKSRGINYAFLYRYCKNDSRHFEIRFRPSQNAFDYVKEKFNEINVLVDKQEPEKVEKEFFLGSIRCAFCPFSKECWGDEDALKSFFGNLPKKKKWPENLSSLEHAEEIGGLFQTFETALKWGVEKEKTERRICELLTHAKVPRIRLPNNNIYEVKYLKTPKPHYELRRTKL